MVVDLSPVFSFYFFVSDSFLFHLQRFHNRMLQTIAKTTVRDTVGAESIVGTSIWFHAPDWNYWQLHCYLGRSR